jgi:hypothetical protein
MCDVACNVLAAQVEHMATEATESRRLLESEVQGQEDEQRRMRREEQAKKDQVSAAAAAAAAAAASLRAGRL